MDSPAGALCLGIHRPPAARLGTGALTSARRRMYLGLPMKRRSPQLLVLVVLAVLAALSHVCVLPGHLEAHAEGGHSSAPPVTGHEGVDASCEAAPPVTPHAAPAAVKLVVVAPAAPLATLTGVSLVHPNASRSSPLFLVHLALLI
jgi:hypothetical protein